MRRRDFLAALPPLAVAAPALRAAPRLKITGLRVVPLKTVKDVGSLEPAWNPGGAMQFRIGGGSYVEGQTDQGLTGIGPGRDPALRRAFQAQLVGKDPFDTEQHAARLRYYAAGVSYRGSASVDIALWDL